MLVFDLAEAVRPLGRVADAKYEVFGGSERIRTSETRKRPHDFESCAFNHSATLPPLIIPYLPKICYHRPMESLNRNTTTTQGTTPVAREKSPSPDELEFKIPNLEQVQKTLGKITLENLKTPEDFFLTDEQRAEIAENYREKERDHAIDDITFHAEEVKSVEQDFAKELQRKQGKIGEKEFEKWEDAFTDEWRKIEKIESDQNLTIRQQAEGKQRIRTYFKEEELDQTIEAYAGNFYHERSRALRNLVENSNDPAKNQELDLIDGFAAAVFRHLDFKYPKDEIFLKMDPERFESSRTKAHNDVIHHLNDLNDLAKKYGARPFTVRNFWSSEVKNQTPAMSSLMRYDRDIVEEYYYQAFASEEDKRKTAAERLRAYGLY